MTYLFIDRLDALNDIRQEQQQMVILKHKYFLDLRTVEEREIRPVFKRFWFYKL